MNFPYQAPSEEIRCKVATHFIGGLSDTTVVQIFVSKHVNQTTYVGRCVGVLFGSTVA